MPPVNRQGRHNFQMTARMIDIQTARPDQTSPGAAASGRGKVVLLLPHYSGPPLGPPLGLLSLASPLLAAGYDVRIIDAKIEADWLQQVEQETADALCFGVSLLTGPMIYQAIEASRLVKRLRPDLPVVFGGWHPSLLPEQTLAEPFVDVVVRNQGEVTFLELVRRFEAGLLPEGVAGCFFKRGREICRNPDRPVSRIAELPSPAFAMVDFDAYEKAGGGRSLTYATSVGCPYACNYCTDTIFYNRRFNAYPAERVVREVTALVEKHGLKTVTLLDSNFLVDTKRAVRIADGFLKSGVEFRWKFQASTDLLCRLSDDEVRLMGRSGLDYIGFGSESGSEQVLELMNKPHQTVPDMFEAARKCEAAGVRANFNLILGFPGETEDHRRETLRVMAEIGRRFESVTFSPNLFTPYPGIEVWRELKRRGMRQPENLAGWADLALGANVLPWMRGATFKKVEQSMSLLLLATELAKRFRKTKSRTERALLQALRKPVGWRLRHQFYRWPVELWLYETQRRLVWRRSLLNGQGLSHTLEPTSS